MPEWNKISSEVASMDGVDVVLAKVECGNAKDTTRTKISWKNITLKDTQQYCLLINLEIIRNMMENVPRVYFQVLGINENSANVSEGLVRE